MRHCTHYLALKLLEASLFLAVGHILVDPRCCLFEVLVTLQLLQLRKVLFESKFQLLLGILGPQVAASRWNLRLRLSGINQDVEFLQRLHFILLAIKLVKY